MLKYVLFGSGPLTVLGGVEGLAWIPTKYANATEDFPDIEIHFVSGSPGKEETEGRSGVTVFFLTPVLSENAIRYFSSSYVAVAVNTI